MELQFRIGVTHGAHWFRVEAARLASEGKASEEIASRLQTLEQVLLRWRTALMTGSNDLPSENPWEWDPSYLEEYIEKTCQLN